MVIVEQEQLSSLCLTTGSLLINNTVISDRKACKLMIIKVQLAELR